jgi:hypothetical protein
MKTPEEIKKGLEQCAETETCEHCHYHDDCMEVFRNTPLTKDALAYIQQLESRLAQVERERDGAVSDISRASAFLCRACRKNDWPNCEAGRNNLDSDDVIECDDFEWRGVCTENTKEE